MTVERTSRLKSTLENMLYWRHVIYSMTRAPSWHVLQVFSFVHGQVLGSTQPCTSAMNVQPDTQQSEV